MTTNQIAFWNLKETERSNKAREDETRRSNIAKETENVRSNLAKEQETNRSNLASERITNSNNKWRNVNDTARTALQGVKTFTDAGSALGRQLMSVAGLLA